MSGPCPTLPSKVKAIDGQPVCPDAAPAHLYFSIVKNCLYRVGRDTQTGEIITHFLVPKSHREMVFTIIPWLGIWGVRTQNRTMDFLAGHLGRRT